MMDDTALSHLSNELEATTRALQHRMADLQQNLTKLQQSPDDQYQFTTWTQGATASCVAEIASLLARRRTLQETISLFAAG